jgi:hypothetical protein
MDLMSEAPELVPVETPYRFGTVILKEWFTFSDGRQYGGIAGYLKAMPNRELAGFDASNKESNFCITVIDKEAPSEAKETFVVFGCQIKAVHIHDYIKHYPRPSSIAYIGS